ncbi:Holliday junction resolvase RuvX [Parvularcula sp. ZS-1/3]|uniref:Putative pre-16S rRNA nuclease n=1 Tax=Parvularcula mediterranea TaxID=2732508 RepID=A0A7Y3RN41_9PROT|nr:Holliday junction resolvase RuvX [Parvularcula mediterranea]NNU16680.1 Holliday junction resolvase RuvX [Parvularcula mediterranea]
MAKTINALKDVPGPLFGLDIGTKTIGLAVSDPAQSLATPLETIKRTKFQPDAKAILDLAEARNVTAFVLGLPLNMDGTPGPRAQATKGFASHFKKLTELPIVFWDERLSTAAAERELIGLDVSRAKRAAVIDSHAASFILQGALDRLKSLRSEDA